ncbi:hypothetical protein M413DRAFT_31517 [Hebeloma cylindrosporum]|uniref:DUF6534 domain-containing protein n=1 Tax=Hebeloma cylindrosporum TaxID=76867 RepID=A0A0C3BZ14_HEBCY|nr:hypothetical protein M413DRAFT_31517 [Hebeloma cylindrosporum h7]
MSTQEIHKISRPELLTIPLNSILLGVLSVQVFLYSLAFPNDRVYMKCLVHGIYILELLQSVLAIYAGFRKFVTGFGDAEAVDRVNTAWLSIPILTAIGERSDGVGHGLFESLISHQDTFIVQGFYAHRISILAKANKVAGAIIALSLIQLGGGIVVGVHTVQKKYYSSLTAPKYLVFQGIWVGQIWIVGSVLCDIVIAVCMTYYLSRYDSTIQQTKMILKKIIRLTIGTGSLTAIIGIVAFFLAVLPNSPGYYQVPVSIIGKVYANSMLVLLNSRMLLRSNHEETPPMNVTVMRFRTASHNSNDDAIDDHAHLSVDNAERAGPSRTRA